MALKGTLEDFGIADIFQLIGQQQKTGLLILTKKDNVVHVLFRDGFIVSAESKNRDVSERLGQMMVQAELITADQLNETMSIQKKKLQKLGSILLERNFIKKSELDEFIYLQTRDTIFRLFRWNAGTYEFEPQDVESNSEFFQPISAEHILMDGFRVIDEWPAIRKRVGDFGTIYERVPGKSVSKQAVDFSNHDDVDRAFSAFEEGHEDAGHSEKLDPNSERVFEVIDGKRDVAKLTAVSRLGEFDTCRALVNLLDLGWIQAAQSVFSEETVKEFDKLSIDLYQDYESPKRSILQFIPQVFHFLGLALAFSLIFSYLGIGPFQHLFRSGRNMISRNVYYELVSEYYLQRLQTSLEVYYLKNNHYPSNLDDLSKADLVGVSDLRFPWKNRYIYRSDGATYFLEKPFY